MKINLEVMFNEINDVNEGANGGQILLECGLSFHWYQCNSDSETLIQLLVPLIDCTALNLFLFNSIVNSQYLMQ